MTKTKQQTRRKKSNRQRKVIMDQGVACHRNGDFLEPVSPMTLLGLEMDKLHRMAEETANVCQECGAEVPNRDNSHCDPCNAEIEAL